jgi:hypothetical protein
MIAINTAAWRQPEDLSPHELKQVQSLTLALDLVLRRPGTTQATNAAQDDSPYLDPVPYFERIAAM